MTNSQGAPTGEGVLMRGYVIRDENDYLWVRDRLSTWMINNVDVLSREDWTGVEDPRFTGTPQILRLRDGAEIHEMRSVRLVAHERPTALGDVDRTLQILGSDLIEQLSRNMMIDIKLMAMNESGDLEVVGDAGAGDGGAPQPTWCDVSDPSGWGTIIKKDD